MLIAVAPTIMNGDTDTVRNLVELKYKQQLQILTWMIQKKRYRQRLIALDLMEVNQIVPIQGTGIPSELTNANPASQAPISGMEVLTRENETREGIGAFANLTNTTR